MVGAGDEGVGCFFTGALDAVDVGFGGGLGLVEVEGEIAGIWKRFGSGKRLGHVAQLFRSLEIVSAFILFTQSSGLISYMLDLRNAHCWFPTICFDQLIGVIQSPSMSGRDDFYSGFSSTLRDSFIPLLRIRIGVPFEDQVSDLPCLEKLR